MLNVLIAERDTEFRQKVKKILTDGYSILEADNGIEAIEISERENIAIYLINSEMPFILERDFMGRFDNLTNSPILVYGEEGTLNELAENYPFIHLFDAKNDPAIIRKKVDSLRFHLYGRSDDPRHFIFDGIEIDYYAKKVRIDNQEVKMTPKEYELLVFLLSNADEQFSREQLLERVWAYEFLGDSRTIDTHVKSLRNKLGPYRNLLVTIWGKGYKIELPQE